MDDPALPPRPRAPWWRRAARLPIAMMLASLLAALGIVQLTFHTGQLIYRSVTWSQETRSAQARITELRRDLRILEDARAAANDPAYLAELARCQGFVGAGERLLVSPQDPTANEPTENCDFQRLP